MNHESIFFRSLRAFFVTLFGMIGALIGLVLIVLLCVALFSSSDEKKALPSNVQILPDAEGNRKELSHSAPIILQIVLDGEIGKESLTAKKIQSILLDSREDEFKGDRVKGILLVIDSPGGGANETNLIYHALKTYKARYHVPVMAYVNGMCCSGGYYIACAADKIFTSDVSLIGSVGVLAWPPYFNVEGVMDKLGVTATTLSAGKDKDAMNPTRPWKPDETANRQELVDFYYGNFVDVVTANRPHISREKLVSTYGAHVFPAPLAQEYGFIDQANLLLSDALKEIVQAAGITESYQVICFKTKSWWKELFEQRSSPLFTGRIQHELIVPNSGQGASFNYLYVP